MKFARSCAVLLPIALTLMGCERRDAGQVVSPPPGSPPAAELTVVESRWITEGASLESEVARASGNPLVQRALSDSPHPRLTPYFAQSLRLEGTVSDGSRIGATILPYAVDADPTHAVFATLLERDGTQGSQISEYSELIVGRQPTALETGFHAISLGGRTAWIKTTGGYLAAGAFGAASGVSPTRRSLTKFLECWVGQAPAACVAGAAIAREIAPTVPQAAAVGCGVGVLAAGGACALDYLR